MDEVESAALSGQSDFEIEGEDNGGQAQTTLWPGARSRYPGIG